MISRKCVHPIRSTGFGLDDWPAPSLPHDYGQDIRTVYAIIPELLELDALQADATPWSAGRALFRERADRARAMKPRRVRG